MLPYAVVLLGLLYLFLHYSGAFEEIARRLGGLGRAKERQTRTEEEDRDRRLIIFEEFLDKDPDPSKDDE